MSLYKFAGVSTLKGRCRVRWANDILRIKVLAANGHTGIDIVPLREPMTKLSAVEYLLSIDFDNGNRVVRQTLEDELSKRQPKSAARAPAEESAEEAVPF